MALHNIVRVNDTTVLLIDGNDLIDPKAWFFDM